jgi:hypothetical protein
MVWCVGSLMDDQTPIKNPINNAAIVAARTN